MRLDGSGARVMTDTTGPDRSFQVPTVVVSLRRRAETIRRSELECCERRLTSLHERDARLVESLTTGIVHKLIEMPAERIRQAAGTPEADLYIEALRDLFGLETGPS